MQRKHINSNIIYRASPFSKIVHFAEVISGMWVAFDAFRNSFAAIWWRWSTFDWKRIRIPFNSAIFENFSRHVWHLCLYPVSISKVVNKMSSHAQHSAQYCGNYGKSNNRIRTQHTSRISSNIMKPYAFLPLFSLLQWTWVCWTWNRQKFPIHETRTVENDDRQGYLDGCRLFDCALCACSTNGLLSVNMDNSSFIINSKQNICLNARTNALLTERCLMCKLEAQSVECDFWHLCRTIWKCLFHWKTNVKMNHAGLAYAFISVVNPVCNDSDKQTVVIDQHKMGNWKTHTEREGGREAHRRTKTRQKNSTHT